MVNFEDLITHIAEVERCQKHPQTKSVPPVLFFGKFLRKWNPAIQTGISQTREHHKQHRHPHTRCMSPSPNLHQFRHGLKQQPVPELQPDSPRPYLQQFFSGPHGGWWKWQNEFWQNLELTQYLLEIKWSPHTGSHFSQTFHRIARLDYQLVDLHA